MDRSPLRAAALAGMALLAGTVGVLQDDWGMRLICFFVAVAGVLGAYAALVGAEAHLPSARLAGALSLAGVVAAVGTVLVAAPDRWGPFAVAVVVLVVLAPGGLLLLIRVLRRANPDPDPHLDGG